ncbi:hypothetical protein CALVIDRAFT_391844 [Calocera viscosa TUFC12733]|uniref:Uncharacterized protein n=1 Tax=Calocera viscosa (strain TUFC12733) TaxID=1330018 RepID=A0A167GFK6_CALVF|nr:hypothetical protein CALVIDRAFT_391844 [Calocera viscosa TUFC12733]
MATPENRGLVIDQPAASLAISRFSSKILQRLQKATTSALHAVRLHNQRNLFRRMVRRRTFTSSTCPIPPIARLPDDVLIARLPDDVLALIFEEAADILQYRQEHKYIKGHGYHSQVFRPFQLTATAVCRQWRIVALDTVILWTCIEIVPGIPQETLDLWLLRARIAPLDITLNLPPDKITRVDYAEYLQLLNHVSHHLRRLTLSAEASFLAFVAARWLRAAPMLEQLTVITYKSYAPRTGRLYVEYLRPSKVRPVRALPALRHIILSTLYPAWWHTVISWDAAVRNSIRSLRLEHHTHTDIHATLALLRSLPNLTSLHISGQDTFWQRYHPLAHTPAQEPISLHSLKYLEIRPDGCWRGNSHRYLREPYDTFFFQWLELLDSPALERVTIPGDAWKCWLRYTPVPVAETVSSRKQEFEAIFLDSRTILLTETSRALPNP